MGKKDYKALYFDLSMNSLEKHYSSKNPKGAYRKIKTYLLHHNFSHAQYSGYHSKFKTTDLEIFDFIYDMNRQFLWLKPCLTHFEVTNIGENHDLMKLFEAVVPEPERKNPYAVN